MPELARQIAPALIACQFEHATLFLTASPATVPLIVSFASQNLPPPSLHACPVAVVTPLPWVQPSPCTLQTPVHIQLLQLQLALNQPPAFNLERQTLSASVLLSLPAWRSCLHPISRTTGPRPGTQRSGAGQGAGSVRGTPANSPPQPSLPSPFLLLLSQGRL